jgi:hypothetical protein
MRRTFVWVAFTVAIAVAALYFFRDSRDVLGRRSVVLRTRVAWNGAPAATELSVRIGETEWKKLQGGSLGAIDPNRLNRSRPVVTDSDVPQGITEAQYFMYGYITRPEDAQLVQRYLDARQYWWSIW